MRVARTRLASVAIGRLEDVTRTVVAHSFGRGLLKSIAGRTSMWPIPGMGHARHDLQGLVQIARLDHHAARRSIPPVSMDGPVGRRHLAVLHLNGDGFFRRIERGRS